MDGLFAHEQLVEFFEGSKDGEALLLERAPVELVLLELASDERERRMTFLSGLLGQLAIFELRHDS